MARQGHAAARDSDHFAAPARTEAHRPSATPALAPPPFTARTLPSLARHLIAKAHARAGFRTLVTGEGDGVSAGQVAVGLARQMARQQAAGDPARLEPRWHRAGARSRRGADARHHRRARGARHLRGRDRAHGRFAGARDRRRIERGGLGGRQGQGPRQHAARCARRRLRSRGHRRRARRRARPLQHDRGPYRCRHRRRWRRGGPGRRLPRFHSGGSRYHPL